MNYKFVWDERSKINFVVPNEKSKKSIFPLTYKINSLAFILEKFNILCNYELILDCSSNNKIKDILIFFPDKEKDILDKMQDYKFIDSKRLIFKKEEDCKAFIKYLNTIKFLSKV